MNIPRLHQETIEEVKERADIYDVVSEYVVLKKRGKDFLGLCPFHEEKTPSFTVSPSKQMYYCFGCGAGGNAIKFLMEIGKHSFAEVVLDLAKRYQVPIKTLEPEERQEFQRQLSMREQLYEILAIAASFYQHTLRQPQGSQALDYLKSKRQLGENTIQQFQLGYAPPTWETLYSYLVQQKRYPTELVEQAGLIKPRKSGGGYYDQFRDRLMIPIHDVQGRVIGFGGRTLGDDQPKYLNSPETRVFDKGKTLFALDKAKTAIGQADQAVVVEGYFDAIALHAAGITNVVASLGTALSLHQVRQLLRYTESKQIVLNFDADVAGIKAAERAIGEIANLAYSGEIQLRILTIPDGKDADEFLKTSGSPEPYKQLLLDAPLWLNWQIEQILKGKNLQAADEYQQAYREILQLLTQLDQNDTRIYYVNYCAERLSQGNTRLIPILAQDILKQINRPQKKSDLSAKNSSEKSRQESRENQQPPRADLIQESARMPEELSEEPSYEISDDTRDNISIVYSVEANGLSPLLAKSPRVLTNISPNTLLEQAEARLLRLYLHCPEYRAIIIDTLEERNLDFTLSHHRLLWQQIAQIESADREACRMALKEIDIRREYPIDTPDKLISKLHDCLINYPEFYGKISPLFHLDEYTEKDIFRVEELIQDAASSMERANCEELSRYYLKLWQETNATTDPEKWQQYGEQLYQAKERIKELDEKLNWHYYYR
ncbi:MULTISPECIES: DNA primase [Planktothricoides]|uniref:DNA primase n=1 Tax=Planktothricoides raciborskii FACHB-1370 TaxID=2949576 RepID=A0ABR8ENW6_9CYAN|nr:MULTISPECIES: DNA primase [Planktothricoides]KOR33856.1 DNA primase [Planktothricoides sp. SR001]MBD2547590.1 DNA primase [Planktothricoides raciborskii FACHB-1370]MBD2586194.1 DNA primase [Planktothricoides raciborskii FACHB-1261]